MLYGFKGEDMKKFNYNGKEMTFLELLPFSAVPEKTLRSRLFSGSSLWGVESALNTPFGEKGKVDEMSVSGSLKIEKRAKQPKTQEWGKPIREKETFYCSQCRTSKKIILLGKTFKNNNSMCTSCCEKAANTFNMTKQEIKAKDRAKIGLKKAYSKELSDTQLFFITRENN